MTNLSNIVEVLAKQALGGNQQASGQSGLGGILGSVLGQMGGNTSSGAQGGLGGVLGSVLGQVTGNNNTPSSWWRCTKFINCSGTFNLRLGSATRWFTSCS